MGPREKRQKRDAARFCVALRRGGFQGRGTMGSLRLSAHAGGSWRGNGAHGPPDAARCADGSISRRVLTAGCGEWNGSAGLTGVCLSSNNLHAPRPVPVSSGNGVALASTLST
jgi:hypothetical protein